MAAPLQIPAMRGVIGDWVFYVTLLPFAEVTNRIKKTEEIHSSALLREMIQRALTLRSKNIASYLQSQKQRFFNAIVVGVYEGEPEWNQLNVRKSELFDPANLETRVAESLGVLTLRGDEKLFAIDGQHRVEGIKEFVRELGVEKAKSLEDEVCAIFVAHSNEPSGLQKTRRLFATLNRYAKPVSLTEIIALDEDDVVALTCRDLLENHPLFTKGRISLTKGKALAPTDSKNFTSLTALYQAMDLYLMQGKRATWQNFKTVRPNDEGVVQQFITNGHQFWNALIDAIPALKRVQDLDASKPLPKSCRSQKGGDLLFRAIAPTMLVRCLKRAMALGMNESVFIKRFSKIPRSLSKSPWLGVLWDGSNMMIGEKNQQVAESLILWMVDCDPEEKKIKADDLKKRLGVVLNKPPEQCALPAKIS
jgi:DNA sulfur modification protein DndB